jgi:pimeloyl-ACP methyl ester carboxylesterase
MSNKPQLVIVPGAWHAPFYMANMIGKLETLGYTVHTQQMPSVGNPNPPKDLSEDVAALDAMVEKAIGTSNDVVVICHSWGGMVTTSGLVGLSKKERTEEGKQGGVVNLGYMAAFLVDKGSNLADLVGDEPPPWYKIEVRLGTIFYICIRLSLALLSSFIPTKRIQRQS